MLMKRIFLLLLVSTTINNQSCPNQDKKCGSCDHSECEYCYASYPGSDGRCIDSTTQIENCLTYLKKDQCKQCVFGYNLVNNSCVKITIENCIRVDKQNNCIVCRDKSFLIDSKCVSNKCTIPNCKHCGNENGTQICILCDNGYSIFPIAENVQCLKTDLAGCIALNFYNKKECSLCRAHYYFSNGKCKKTDVYHLLMESSIRIWFVVSFLNYFIIFN